MQIKDIQLDHFLNHFHFYNVQTLHMSSLSRSKRDWSSQRQKYTLSLTHTHTHGLTNWDAFDLQTQQSEGEFKAPFWASAPCAGMCGTTGYEGGEEDGGRERREGGGKECRCHAPAAYLTLR